MQFNISVFLGALSALTNANPLEARANPPKTLAKPGVFDDLVRYAGFTRASSIVPCKTAPYGATIEGNLSEPSTDTQATLFRSDSTSEFIMSFPGTASVQDFVTDFTFVPLPYQMCPSQKCLVHSGFLVAYTSIAGDLKNLLDEKMKAHPTYKITVTGHSLGGALGQLAYADFKGQSYSVTGAYTYGQPRVGNKAFADYIDTIAGAASGAVGEYHRTTHTFDGIPQLPTLAMGFRHSRTEYWELDGSMGTPNANTTYRCYTQEASDCNLSEGRGRGFTSAHSSYAGLVAPSCG